MRDNVVRDGLIGSMSQILAKKLGRKVQVHRIEQAKYVHGKPFTNSKTIRYTLAIEGCHPPAFYGMTCNEVKQRLAMICDLIYSGVLNVPTPIQDTSGASGQGTAAALPGSGAASDYRPEVEGDEGRLQCDDQPADPDDRY